MRIFKRSVVAELLTIALLVLTSTESAANTKAKKRDSGPLTCTEVKEAERRLSEMGYWTGRLDGVIDNATQTAVIAFQKWEGRKTTGRLTRTEFNAIRDAASPEPRLAFNVSVVRLARARHPMRRCVQGVGGVWLRQR